jgi:hypothetical protein
MTSIRNWWAGLSDPMRNVLIGAVVLAVVFWIIF